MHFCYSIICNAKKWLGILKFSLVYSFSYSYIYCKPCIHVYCFCSCFFLIDSSKILKSPFNVTDVQGKRRMCNAEWWQCFLFVPSDKSLKSSWVNWNEFWFDRKVSLSFIWLVINVNRLTKTFFDQITPKLKEEKISYSLPTWDKETLKHISWQHMPPKVPNKK